MVSQIERIKAPTLERGASSYVSSPFSLPALPCAHLIKTFHTFETSVRNFLSPFLSIGINRKLEVVTNVSESQK